MEIFSFYYNISKICSFSKQGHITLSNALYNATLHLYSVWRGSPGSHWQVRGVKRLPLAKQLAQSRLPPSAPGSPSACWSSTASVSPRPSPPVPESFTVLSLKPSQPLSLVDLFHLPNDLLFEDGQDGVIFPHLLEDHTTVELITHFLKVIPENPETRRQREVSGHVGHWSYPETGYSTP